MAGSAQSPFFSEHSQVSPGLPMLQSDYNEVICIHIRCFATIISSVSSIILTLICVIQWQYFLFKVKHISQSLGITR